MKKILLVTLDFPPQTGGVANHYLRLCRDSSESVVVLAPRVLGYHDKESFRIYREDMVNGWLIPQWLPLFTHIYSTAKREKVTEIWVGQPLPVGTVVWLLCSLLRVPYHVFFHGMEFVALKTSARKRWLLRQILRHAEKIVVNSNFTANLVENFGVNREKILLKYPQATIVLNDHNTLNQLDKERMKENYGLQGKKILITVGRLVARKGQDRVIESLPSVMDVLPDVHYCIIGNGEDQMRLEEIIRVNKMRDHVTIINGVSDAELSKWYQLADAFIMVSRDMHGDVEGYGIVYREAASFGLPVIAGRSGGATEAVDDLSSARLVDPESREEISHAIIETLQNHIEGKI